MVASTQVRHQSLGIFKMSLVTLLLWGMAAETKAQGPASESADQALTKELMADVTGQIEKYCKARKLHFLKVTDFRGTVGTRSPADVKQDWLDSLQERGITMRERCSTCISGCIMSHEFAGKEIILVQCTLSDHRGAELCTFRVRRVTGA